MIKQLAHGLFAKNELVDKVPVTAKLPEMLEFAVATKVVQLTPAFVVKTPDPLILATTFDSPAPE